MANKLVTFSHKETLDTLTQLKSDVKDKSPVYIKVELADGIEEFYPVDAIGSNSKCILVVCGSTMLTRNDISQLEPDAWVERRKYEKV